MATLKPRFEVDENDLMDEKADLVASGYEAICPGCQEVVKLIEVPASADVVWCYTCEMWFEVDLPEHAYA